MTSSANNSNFDFNENCCQAVIRNNHILKMNTTCQTIGVVVGTSAAVAGFYFAYMTGTWSSYGFGGAGAALASYSFCGLSYLIDYKKVLVEARKVKKLEQAKAELQDQVLALEEVERGIAGEEKEIAEDIGVLKEQVEKLSFQVVDLQGQLSQVGLSSDRWLELADQIKCKEEQIAGHIETFSSDLTSAYSLHAQNQKHRLEAIGALENLDLRLDSREKKMVDLMSKIDEMDKFFALKKDLETFKTESPHEYEAIIARYPSLRI